MSIYMTRRNTSTGTYMTSIISMTMYQMTRPVSRIHTDIATNLCGIAIRIILICIIGTGTPTSSNPRLSA